MKTVAYECFGKVFTFEIPDYVIQPEPWIYPSTETMKLLIGHSRVDGDIMAEPKYINQIHGEVEIPPERLSLIA